MTLRVVLDSQSDRTAAIMAFLAFCCTSLLTILPILRHTYLPLVDLPNHMARHYLATAPAGPLDTFYEYAFSLVPNSAVDFAWFVFGSGMDPVAFSRNSLAFFCVALTASTMLLARHLHGRWSIWQAAVALVCYNACFFWGFQNFIISAPFAILSLTIYLWSEKFTIARRILILAPIVFALYLLHFFAFLILAIAVFGRELQRIYEARTDWRRAFVQATLLALPFAVPIAWLIFDVVTGPESAAGSYSAFGGFTRRIEVLQSTVLAPGLELPPTILVTGLGILILLSLFAFAAYSQALFGGLKIAPKIRGPLLALSLSALLMPFWLNGVAWVHIRFGFVVVAVFLAATQWRNLSRPNAVFIATLVVALVASRSVAVDRFAAMHSDQVEDFVTLVDAIPQGERLIVATVSRDIANKRHWHVGAYAVIYGNVFTPTLFQGVHSLQVKPEWAEYATSALHAVPLELLLYDWGTDPVIPYFEFMRNWDEKYTHLILMDSPDETFSGLPQLDPITTQGRFTLFKIIPPQ